MENKKKRSPGELLDAIHAMALEDELEAISKMSDDEIAADIRALGGDPEAIGKRGAAFVASELVHQKRLASFRDEAAEELTRALTAAAAAPKTPALPRKELEKRIDFAMKRSPRLAGPISVAFKKRAREKASDDELRSFLDTIEKLEAIAHALEEHKTKGEPS